MKIRTLLIVALLFLTLPLMSQKRKVKQLTPEQIEQQERQEKLERITAKTQCIMFIDSMVVNKQQFLQAYHLAPEVGKIACYQDFFNTQKQPNAYVYANELGSQCYYSIEQEDSTMQLYSSMNINCRWSHPLPLQGINEDSLFHRVNYPFMMGDGQTFYFAAEGDDGLGGYDIYVTRYDADDNQFLRPANIGMPFNSEANDYLYVIDEYSNLGWFATDRNQPADSVCIYTFIPPQTRQTYNASGFSPEEIASFARIDRIADTWTDETAYQEALQRLQKVVGQEHVKTVVSDFHFIINDDVVYTRASDFKVNGNLSRFQKLTTLNKQYDRLVKALDRARDYYAIASEKERNELRPEILASEQKQHELYLDIHNLEKLIRNYENIFLTKNM